MTIEHEATNDENGLLENQRRGEIVRWGEYEDKKEVHNEKPPPAQILLLPGVQPE